MPDTAGEIAKALAANRNGAPRRPLHHRTKPGNQVKRFLPWLAPALCLAASAHAQDAKLTIIPAHDKLIQEYVVTESVRPVAVTIPLEIGATVPNTVPLDPVPLGLVAKVPEVRNYEYFVAGGKVVFVEPYTRKILQIVR